MILGGIIVIGESSLSHRLIVTAVIFTTLIFQEFSNWIFPILIHPLYNIHASVFALFEFDCAWHLQPYFNSLQWEGYIVKAILSYNK